MGFGLITAGLFFIFNPYVNVIDILPDIIGYLLILAGTFRLAMLNADIMKSRKYFGAMIWISFGRIAASLMLLHFRDGFLSLSFTIIAAVADCIYSIRAFSLLFSALDTMSCMIGETKSSSDTVRQFTPIAIVSKNVLALLPEFTELSVEDEFGNAGLIAYKSMFILICVLIGLAVGIMWLIISVGYLKALSRDERFIFNLESRYNAEIAPDTALFTRLELTSFLKLLPVPLFFLIQLNFDGYYIVPEFLCPVLLAVLLLRIRKYADITPVILPAFASAAVLTVKYVMMFIYSDKFGSYYYPYEAEGFLRSFLAYIIPAAVGYLFLIFTAVRLKKTVFSVIDRHTGERSHGDARVEQLNMRVAGELKKRYKFITVWAIILCALLAMSSAGAAFFNMGYIFAILADAVAIAFTYSFCSELSSQISRRYI